jgi:hypothetical protein
MVLKIWIMLLMDCEITWSCRYSVFWKNMLYLSSG